MGIIFVAGSGTDVGKTYVTGLMGKYLLDKGNSVITMKLAQTGCSGMSADIIKHREIMGITPGVFDEKGITCPYVFNFPSSPALAAKLENTRIDIKKIKSCIEELSANFDKVIIEGVGGLFVPLNDSTLTINFLTENKYPVVIAATPVLGSINHTLLSIEALKACSINVMGLAYNLFFKEKKEITEDTRNVISIMHPDVPIVDIKIFNAADFPDFSLFGL